MIKTLSGKMVLPDDSPYTTGGIGLLGTGPTADLIDDIDTLLMVGTNFPYTKHLPAPGRVKVVQVEIDPTRIGNRLPTDVPLVGDVSTTLEALLPRLQAHTDHGHLNKYQQEMADWRDKMAALESPERDPIAPQYVVGLLDELAADDAVHDLRLRHDRHLGCATLDDPWRPRVLPVRQPSVDGTRSAVRDRHRPRQPRPSGDRLRRRRRLRDADGRVQHRVPVRLADQGRHQQQRIRSARSCGSRWFSATRNTASGSANPQPDYAAWATACGGYGIRVDKADDLQVALGEALAFDGPAIVDVAVDPNEPPMPGKVTYEQAKKFAEAFLKGQPHKAAIATTLFKDRIQQLKA